MHPQEALRHLISPALRLIKRCYSERSSLQKEARKSGEQKPRYALEVASTSVALARLCDRAGALGVTRFGSHLGRR